MSLPVSMSWYMRRAVTKTKKYCVVRPSVLRKYSMPQMGDASSSSKTCFGVRSLSGNTPSNTRPLSVANSARCTSSASSSRSHATLDTRAFMLTRYGFLARPQ